jgi:hypothetical protein
MTTELEAIGELRRKLREKLQATLIGERITSDSIDRVHAVVSRLVREAAEAIEERRPMMTGVDAGLVRLRGVAVNVLVPERVPDHAQAYVLSHDVAVEADTSSSAIHVDFGPKAEWRWEGGAAPMTREAALLVCRLAGMLP